MKRIIRSMPAVRRTGSPRIFSQIGTSMLDTVDVEISVVLGRTLMPIHQLLRMGRGAVIELDNSENDEVLILANNMPIAVGEVLIRTDRIAIEVKRVLRRNAMRVLVD